MRQASSTCCMTRRSVLILLGLLLLAIVGPAVAAVVVEPEGTGGTSVPPDQTQQPPPYLAPPPQATPGPQTPQPYVPSPSTAPGTAQQQPLTGMPSVPTMPLPPTYSPGSPAGYGATDSMAGPEAALPVPPTSFGPYDLASPGTSGGSAQPGYGWSGTRQGVGLGMGQPPAPTPTSTGPLGLPQMDPRYGPYQPTNIEEATAPRQAATVGQARASVLRQAKPFSDYRRPRAYSPYMSLLRSADTARGINPYYEYVRPALEQQQEDQQRSREIRGLQDTARYDQGLLQSGQRPGTLVPQQKPPATFMNYQQFYGGAQQFFGGGQQRR